MEEARRIIHEVRFKELMEEVTVFLAKLSEGTVHKIANEVKSVKPGIYYHNLGGGSLEPTTTTTTKPESEAGTETTEVAVTSVTTATTTTKEEDIDAITKIAFQTLGPITLARVIWAFMSNDQVNYINNVCNLPETTTQADMKYVYIIMSIFSFIYRAYIDDIGIFMFLEKFTEHISVLEQICCCFGLPVSDHPFNRLVNQITDEVCVLFFK